MTHRTLILASGSPYRRALLERLRLPFETDSPQIDESPRPGELPEALAMRLALEKARRISTRHPGALVIGSDQVPGLDGRLMGKPGTVTAAIEQLRACSGRCVRFDTGLCVIDASGREQVETVTSRVYFRALSEREIRHYIALDNPLDCAGSFKWESLGIALFERLEGDDPTALEGLPLIALCRMLRNAGLNVLAPPVD